MAVMRGWLQFEVVYMVWCSCHSDEGWVLLLVSAGALVFYEFRLGHIEENYFPHSVLKFLLPFGELC